MDIKDTPRYFSTRVVADPRDVFAEITDFTLDALARCIVGNREGVTRQPSRESNLV